MLADSMIQIHNVLHYALQTDLIYITNASLISKLGFKLLVSINWHDMYQLVWEIYTTTETNYVHTVFKIDSAQSAQTVQ